MEFFIARGRSRVGPCSLQELRSYIYYGSVSLDDHVIRKGESERTPLRSLPEMVEFHSTLELSATKAAEAGRPKGRVKVYREYSEVPADQQERRVAWLLISGCLFWPPRLWRAAGLVLSSKIYRKSKDAHGFQRVWPRWSELIVALLVLGNGLGLAFALSHSIPKAMSLTRQLGEVTRVARRDFDDALFRNGPR